VSAVAFSTGSIGDPMNTDPMRFIIIEGIVEYYLGAVKTALSYLQRNVKNIAARYFLAGCSFLHYSAVDCVYDIDRRREKCI